MMKAIKNILLPVLLLCMVQEAWAAKAAQAVLMSDKTMYFVYDEAVTVGNTYKGKTVSKMWSGDAVICKEVIPGWRDDSDARQTTKVVFDISFAQVCPKRCGYWFMSMNQLTTIENLEYLNTSDVTDMYDMFANCSLLTTLDLSSFDTSKVTDMTSMFQGCSALTTIYVSNLWNVSGVGESANMFKNCTNLEGGKGTKYNDERTNKDYARVDGGSWTPGYLTEKALGTLLLSNDADNAAKISAYSGQTQNVQLMGRTLYKDGKWNTLCLPFDVTIASSPLAGATVKVFDPTTTLVGNTLTLKFTSAGATIPAGTPFIIKWASGADLVNPTFTGVTISGSAQTVTSNDTKVQFVGTFSPFEITLGNINDILYIGSANKIGYAKSARTLKSCRAHFYIPSAASARAVTTIDFIDDEATGIDAMLVNSEKVNNDVFDLQGRRVSQPTKGLYIVNGKKVAIK